MLAIVRIALAEFAKAFAPKVGTPAARDFLWLTVFFTLSAFIVFVGWSARDGIWDRFEQVLLGALPDGGPPIRVTTHIDLRTGISSPIIDKFEKDFPGSSIVPMREFDGQTGAITFPGLSYEAGTTPKEEDLSWGRAKDGATAPFRSFAIAMDSPLWRWIRSRVGDFATEPDRVPLVIAANRSLFQKHFRYERYRRAVVSDLSAPCLVRSELPERVLDPTRLQSIVLKVREWSDAGGSRESFQTFKVIWVDSFPLPEQVAFIMPLQTAEVAMAADTWKEFNLYLEGQGAATERVSTLRLKDVDILSPADKAGAINEFSSVAACLGTVASDQIEDTMICGATWSAEVINDSVVNSQNAALKRKITPGESQMSVVPVLSASSFDMSITTAPQWPMRKADVQRCLQKTRFAKVFASSPAPSAGPGDAVVDLTAASAAVLWKGPSRLELPCSVLTMPGPTLPLIEKGSCTQANIDEARGVGRLPGYEHAMIYSGASKKAEATAASSNVSGSLDDIVAGLLAWKTDDNRQAFRLDSAYESALIRFGVLSTIVDKMAVPLGGGMLVLYLVLSWVILATIFQHRRSQYGLLFMNGVMPRGIEILVSIQISISCAVGCIIGYLFFWVGASLTNDWLKGTDIIRKAAFIIGLDVPTFLDKLSLASIFLIWISMTIVGLVIGNFILRAQRISTARAPIALIKS